MGYLTEIGVISFHGSRFLQGHGVIPQLQGTEKLQQGTLFADGQIVGPQNMEKNIQVVGTFKYFELFRYQSCFILKVLAVAWMTWW